ncbi:unnamed protein product [Cuscuta epithymum]|uniref:Uncharacterized protein n=1 Tax=Cuscuta epithymum TaxID=186058 RepID=A0AAV0EQV0_9ASTE|nr:unnamed protein product [Cuscuta epithymum]
MEYYCVHHFQHLIFCCIHCSSWTIYIRAVEMKSDNKSEIHKYISIKLNQLSVTDCFATTMTGVSRIAANGNGTAPKGHFVVYVGEERKRFVVPTMYLRNASFQKLLDEAAEEFDFQSPEGIVLPCHESVFHDLLILA